MWQLILAPLSTKFAAYGMPICRISVVAGGLIENIFRPFYGLQPQSRPTMFVPRIRILILGALMSIAASSVPVVAFATDEWPAEPWTSATSLTALDADFRNNLSGAHWNQQTRTLWVCLNGPGKFWALTQNEEGEFVVDTQDVRRAEFDIPGDIEAITQADKPDTVFVMVEGQDLIREYEASRYGEPALLREYDISPFVPTAGGLGSEGLAFVPDKYLRINGFVDHAGQRYLSRNGMGGLMFVAHQNGGMIYVFDLHRDGHDFDFVGAYVTSRPESSGLEFDRSSGNLYIWHNLGPNYLEVTAMASFVNAEGSREFKTVKEYFGPREGNLEGLALSDAASDDHFIFITDDDNNGDLGLALYEHSRFELMGSDEKLLASDSLLEISAERLLKNDQGISSLSVLKGPDHGWLQGVEDDGTFSDQMRYRPYPGFSGMDSVTLSSPDKQQFAYLSLAVQKTETAVTHVKDGRDDAEERADGSMYIVSSDLELVTDASAQKVGLRFAGLNLPDNAEVVEAYIQFTVDEASDVSTSLLIRGELSADSPIFSTSRHDLSSRLQTEAGVIWTPPPWNVLNETNFSQRTPDISAVLKEIVKTPGWASGAAVTFLIEGDGKRVAISRDKSATAAPYLYVRYKKNVAPSLPITNRISSSIASSENDVEERADGSIYVNSSDLELVTDRGTQTVGLRFESIDIPTGSEILDARIQFVVDEISADETSLLIEAESVGDSTPFLRASNDLTNRARSAATVSWIPEPWQTENASGAAQTTPNLADIVQETVERTDWHRGSAMTFLISGLGRRVAVSSDKSSVFAPTLEVSYRPPQTELSEFRGVLRRQVSTSADDAEERADGSMYLNSSDLEFVTDSATQLVGMRFSNISLPGEATVISAYLQFSVDEPSENETELVIHGQAAADALPFSSQHHDIRNRKVTSSFITFTPRAWKTSGESSESQRSPDVSPIVREILGQRGWSSGNALSFIVSGHGRRVAHSYDGDPSQAPVLVIEYR